MKKLLIAGLFLFPAIVSAQVTTFDTNLSYSSMGSDVTALQEFLVTQHLLAPQYVTGNFYSLTLAAVKSFQTAESITPISGFVGPITRETINTILASEVSVNEGDAATTTLPVDLSQSTTTSPYLPPEINYIQNVTPVVPTIQSHTIGPVISVRNPPTLTVTNIITTDPSVVAAATDSVTLNSFGLEISAGDENIHLSSIPLYLTLGNGAESIDLGRCEIWAYGAPLNAGGRDINPSGNTQLYIFTLDQGLQVNAGTDFVATVECNVYSTASSGATYSWSVDSNASDWNATGIMYGDSISTSIIQGFGNTISVK